MRTIEDLSQDYQEYYLSCSEFELYMKICECMNFIEKTKRNYANSEVKPDLSLEIQELQVLSESATRFIDDPGIVLDQKVKNFEYWLNFWNYYTRHNLVLADMMEIQIKIKNGEDYSEYMPKVSFKEMMLMMQAKAISLYHENPIISMSLTPIQYLELIKYIFNTLNSYETGLQTNELRGGFDPKNVEVVEFTKDFDCYLSLIEQITIMYLEDANKNAVVLNAEEVQNYAHKAYQVLCSKIRS